MKNKLVMSVLSVVALSAVVLTGCAGQGGYEVSPATPYVYDSNGDTTTVIWGDTSEPYEYRSPHYDNSVIWYPNRGYHQTPAWTDYHQNWNGDKHTTKTPVNARHTHVYKN